MKDNEILVAEISGKRPGNYKQRPTEKFSTRFDHVIISNNSEGYKTEWEIVNVPDDYREWYIANIKNSDNAWYAPMNRSYAIKYAKEHGYKYLIQLDDNIMFLEIASLKEIDGGIWQRRRIIEYNCMDPYIEMLVCVLENTNAAMSGLNICSMSSPTTDFLSERYCYSFFALKVNECPNVFHGDFEDDIEYRLKLKQMGMACVQICPMRYSKTGQAKTKDLSGCRAEYAKAGLKRGEHMCKLYGDIYSCKMQNRPHRITVSVEETMEGDIHFKHTIKPFKVGVIVYDMKTIKECFARIMRQYDTHKEDKYIIKEKKFKKKKE